MNKIVLVKLRWWGQKEKEPNKHFNNKLCRRGEGKRAAVVEVKRGAVIIDFPKAYCGSEPRNGGTFSFSPHLQIF